MKAVLRIAGLFQWTAAHSAAPNSFFCSTASMSRSMVEETQVDHQLESCKSLLEG